MTERHRFLDVLRGVALCGIFPVNLPFFAMPVLLTERLADDASAFDAVAFHAVESLFAFKFISIFSFLFGIGIVLLSAKCEREGLRRKRALIQRFLALGLFGALHVAFLWYGDILLIYAALGLVLFSLVGLSPRLLVTLGALSLALPILLLGGMLAFPDFIEQVATDPAKWSSLDPAVERAAATGTREEFADRLFDLHPEFEKAVVLEANLLRQVALRLASYLLYLLIAIPILVPRAAGMMLVGMACAKRGWILRPAENRAIFRRLAIGGLALGLPIQAVATSLSLGTPSAVNDVRSLLLLSIASIPQAFGYIGVVGLLCSRAEPPRALRPFEALGRVAFSGYIAQSFLASLLFQSWGAGYFGALGFAPLLAVALVVWTIELTASSAWLARFRQGPLEGLWRRITYAGTRAKTPS